MNEVDVSGYDGLSSEEEFKEATVECSPKVPYRDRF